MNLDSQWPRYQVFVQKRPEDPFQDAGSVHAPDTEMALLNARDVFARRPECYAMWVVPVEAIFSRTAQELETDLEATEDRMDSGGLYQIFYKVKAAGTLTWVCTQQAAGASQALHLAMAQQSKRHRAFAWWVIPDSAVTRSQPTDYESLYEPAASKTFRLSTDFRTLTAMRNIKTRRSDPTPPGQSDPQANLP